MTNAAIMKIAIPTCLLAAALFAGCGGDSGYGGGTNSAGSGAAASGRYGSTAAGSTGRVSATRNTDLDAAILVDSRGRTLYLFEKDDEPDESYCDGQCAAVWPPLTTEGAPKAGAGVDASKLGSFKRDDGSTQVTYAGHPLYTYVQDTRPGETTGNEVDSFGAEWYAVQPSGEKAE